VKAPACSSAASLQKGNSPKLRSKDNSNSHPVHIAPGSLTRGAKLNGRYYDFEITFSRNRTCSRGRNRNRSGATTARAKVLLKQK
jgi:hypothetical protein